MGVRLSVGKESCIEQYAEPTKQLVVEIFVRDVARSRAFHERLGFELVEDRGAFVALAWERCQLFLDERRDVPPPPAHPGANVRVMVLDGDAVWARTRGMGAPVLAPIGDRPSGRRNLAILDPDGFGVRFGSWSALEEERVAAARSRRDARAVAAL